MEGQPSATGALTEAEKRELMKAAENLIVNDFRRNNAPPVFRRAEPVISMSSESDRFTASAVNYMLGMSPSVRKVLESFPGSAALNLEKRWLESLQRDFNNEPWQAPAAPAPMNARSADDPQTTASRSFETGLTSDGPGPPVHEARDALSPRDRPEQQNVSRMRRFLQDIARQVQKIFPGLSRKTSPPVEPASPLPPSPPPVKPVAQRTSQEVTLAEIKELVQDLGYSPDRLAELIDRGSRTIASTAALAPPGRDRPGAVSPTASPTPARASQAAVAPAPRRTR
ncbi:hypothetical protein ABZ725_51785 [Streptomyces sp. NPDC006872]|uniref:hypothetical protein n=1 Tax=Streptomyces sp. NPDC006872 TaxID=3155720 RepID=UPI0033CE5734